LTGKEGIKVNRIKSILVVIIVSIFVLIVIGTNLALPADTHAHPAYGFTPPAPPPPPDDGGGDDGDNGQDDSDDNNSGSDGGNDSRDDGDDEIPPDYILVELDRCDLSCSVNYEHKPAGQAAPLSTPAEVRVRVQLIHQGSGWIAEGIISDVGGTRISVPYPGQWEIFMMSEPEFIGVTAFDPTPLNLDQLRTDLSAAPISLGMVEANTAEPQLVKCPITCVIDSPPDYMPQTGGDQSTAILIIFTNVAFLLSIGLLMLHRKKCPTERNDYNQLL